MIRIPLLYFHHFSLEKIPIKKMTGIYERTILLISHLYSKWQIFTYRIIFTPHHRQVAKLSTMFLIPRRIANGKHLLLSIV